MRARLGHYASDWSIPSGGGPDVGAPRWSLLLAGWILGSESNWMRPDGRQSVLFCHGFSTQLLACTRSASDRGWLSPAGWAILPWGFHPVWLPSGGVPSNWKRESDVPTLRVLPLAPPHVAFTDHLLPNLPPSWPLDPANESSYILTLGHFFLHKTGDQVHRPELCWSTGTVFQGHPRARPQAPAVFPPAWANTKLTHLCEPLSAFLAARQPVMQPQLWAEGQVLTQWRQRTGRSGLPAWGAYLGLQLCSGAFPFYAVLLLGPPNLAGGSARTGSWFYLVLLPLNVSFSDALSPLKPSCTPSCFSNGEGFLCRWQDFASEPQELLPWLPYWCSLQIYMESFPIPGTCSTIRFAKSHGPSRRAPFPAPRTSGRSPSCSWPQPEVAASSCQRG